ncbi:hypothetical protein AB0T30_10935, partial [Lactobacillus crispatus]
SFCMCFFVQTNHTRKELLFLMFKEINLRNHSSLHKLFYSLQACPVYLRREERIKSHFLVCFLALLVFRLFKQKVPGYSSYELVKTLRKFALTEISPGDYIPIFQRTDLTDKIHESFGFRLDRELITQNISKKFFTRPKFRKNTHFLLSITVKLEIKKRH